MKSSPGVPQEFATGSVCLALFRRDLSLIMRRKSLAPLGEILSLL
jgi:hypothetical protein